MLARDIRETDCNSDFHEASIEFAARETGSCRRRIHEAAAALRCRASAGLMMDARDGPAFLRWSVVAGANREDAAFMNN